MNILVALAFVAIIGSLAAALLYMMRGGKHTEDTERPNKRMANALALRVGLSIALFVCVLIAWKLGYIHPTGLPSGR